MYVPVCNLHDTVGSVECHRLVEWRPDIRIKNEADLIYIRFTLIELCYFKASLRSFGEEGLCRDDNEVFKSGCGYANRRLKLT
ncbi:hypothetical protein E2C01_001418 [Portunus trituberculatus]|uniref:Uncharacterized protein n=1 Tax=Portunus trituberculatus TaxID=210409 RepID=A0A5B7CHS7_PORTR|nr:hypothetical protein [Portunus trituberculatus]